MKKNEIKFKLLLCMIFIGMTAHLFSESYQLDNLLDIALKQSSAVRIENIQNEISEKSYNSSLVDFLPDASYHLSAQDGSLGRIYNSSLSVSKNIYLNDASYYNYKKSYISKKSAALELEDKKKEIALSIFSYYTDILLTQKNVKILKENVDLQKKTYEQIFIQYQNNKKTIYDLQASQIDTLTAITDLLELEKNLFSKRQELFQILGIQDEGYPFEEIILDTQLLSSVDFKDNLKIKVSEMNLQKNQYDANQSYLNMYPNIYVGYSYSLAVSNHKSDYIFKPSEYNDSYTYGIYFNYPLFSFLENGIQYRIQKRQTQIMELTHKDLVEQEQVKYQQAVNDLNIYQQSYQIYKQKAELSKTNLEISQKRFELGVINTLDLDKSRIQYLEAQLNMNTKYYSLLKKQQEINYLISGKVLGKW
ncbi:MAG TPA: TolC family protein [Candidatus Cloacimonadota bacterium]|nr:TolC family protein [Candidatus Cloacimonadota bacterium]